MATRVSMDHVYMVLNNTEHYKLIDVFNVLCEMSTQIDYKKENTSKFLIRTHTNSIYNLAVAIMNESPYMKSRNTITECLNKLRDMSILMFNSEENAWEIKNMDRMIHNSMDGEIKKVGYMHLREFFFTEEFYNLPISDKKIIYYACSIMDTKGFKKFGKLITSLKPSNDEYSSKWMEFLNTDDIYYTKKVLTRVLTNYDLFEDIGEDMRRKELVAPKYKNLSFDKLKQIRKSLKFKFWFKPLKKITDIIGKIKDKEAELASFKVKYRDYFEYIKDTAFSFGKKVFDKLNDRIYYALFKVGRCLHWEIKRKMVQAICLSLYSDGSISAPEKYVSRIAYNCLENFKRA